MMKSKQFIAMILAAMLVVGSAAGPVFAAENMSEADGTEQNYEAAFEDETMGKSESADDTFSDNTSGEQKESVTDVPDEEEPRR